MGILLKCGSHVLFGIPKEFLLTIYFKKMRGCNHFVLGSVSFKSNIWHILTKVVKSDSDKTK